MLGEGLSVHTHICLKYGYSLKNAPHIIFHNKKQSKQAIITPSKTV